jgi:hypothetical protein
MIYDSECTYTYNVVMFRAGSVYSSLPSGNQISGLQYLLALIFDCTTTVLLFALVDHFVWKHFKISLQLLNVELRMMMFYMG